MLRRLVLVAVLVRQGMMLLIILGSSLVIRASRLRGSNTAGERVGESSPLIPPRPGLNETVELVIRGTVGRIESQFRNDIIYSRAQVSVDLIEKGTSVSSVIVEYEGGEVGDIGQAFSNQPRFKEGQRVLLYLTRGEDDAFVVVGGPGGKGPLDSAGQALQQQAEGKQVATYDEPETRPDSLAHISFDAGWISTDRFDYVNVFCPWCARSLVAGDLFSFAQGNSLSLCAA